MEPRVLRNVRDVLADKEMLEYGRIDQELKELQKNIKKIKSVKV